MVVSSWIFFQEDLIDPATEIKEKCAESHCTSYKAKLDECNDRVQSKNKTTETCFEEILDFYHCVDHCAAIEIFKVRLFFLFIALIYSFNSNFSYKTLVFQHVKWSIFQNSFSWWILVEY